MVYVALLRGVNVGGTGKVDMKQLATVFSDAGMASPRTYINSGNVIFSAEEPDRLRLAATLEAAIEASFGFAVPVLVRGIGEIRSIVAAIPKAWTNDAAMKCDVFFLWDEVDRPDVLDALEHDPAVEDVRYTPGAIVRRVDRANAARSRLTRIVGTPLYRQLTARNCNTARKLLELMEDAER